MSKIRILFSDPKFYAQAVNPRVPHASSAQTNRLAIGLNQRGWKVSGWKYGFSNMSLRSGTYAGEYVLQKTTYVAIMPPNVPLLADAQGTTYGQFVGTSAPTSLSYGGQVQIEYADGVAVFRGKRLIVPDEVALWEAIVDVGVNKDSRPYSLNVTKELITLIRAE